MNATIRRLDDDEELHFDAPFDVAGQDGETFSPLTDGWKRWIWIVERLTAYARRRIAEATMS
jgi:hypothetical protein